MWMKLFFTLIVHNLIVDTTGQKNMKIKCDENIIKAYTTLERVIEGTPRL